MFARTYAVLWRSTHAEQCPVQHTVDRAIEHALACPDCQRGEGACQALWAFVSDGPACDCGYGDRPRGRLPGRAGLSAN
jgi:hypothetical protein